MCVLNLHVPHNVLNFSLVEHALHVFSDSHSVWRMWALMTLVSHQWRPLHFFPGKRSQVHFCFLFLFIYSFYLFFCWQLFLSTWAYTWYKIYCCSRSRYTKEQMKHKSSKAYKHFIDNWTQEVLHKKINSFPLIDAKVRYSNMLHKLFSVRRVYTFSSLRHRPQYCTLCIEYEKID